VTPEGKIKRAIKKVLDGLTECYYFMPVQMGLGARTLDFLVCYRGKFFGFEAKAPGEKPTALQKLCMKEIQQAGGEVLTIDSLELVSHLKEWMHIHSATEVLE
jgi:hypothetical protein